MQFTIISSKNKFVKGFFEKSLNFFVYFNKLAKNMKYSEIFGHKLIKLKITPYNDKPQGSLYAYPAV